MGSRQIAAGVVIISILLSFGCAQKERPVRPLVGLAAINDQIVRGKEEHTLLMEGTEAEEEVITENGAARVRELPIIKDGRNPQLQEAKPLRPIKRKDTEEGILLNFDDADIHEVIRVVAETLNLNYIVDPRVSGAVNIRTSRPIPQGELFAVFRKILNVNGLDIIPEGNHYFISPAANPGVQQIYLPDQVGKLQSSPRMIMQVVPLLYLSSGEALNIIAPYISAQGLTYDLAPRNMVIVSDFESKIVDIVQILSFLDVSPLVNFSMRLVRVENAPLFDLHDELAEILGALRVNTPERGFDTINIVPLERVNSLLLVSKSDYLLDNATKWIEELDVVPANGQDSVFIYNVRNSVASELAELVNTLLSEQGRSGERPRAATPAPTTTTERLGERAGAVSRPTVITERTPLAALQFAEGPVLIADDNRNIILLRAMPTDYRRLIKLLERLDSLPRQVLIEVIVAEVSLSDSLEFGVEWAFRNRDLTINGTDYEQQVRSTNFANLADLSTLSGLSYSIFKNAGDVRVLLNALASDTNVSILSSPQILVLNNEAASINVGDQVPIITSEVVPSGTEGTTLTRSIQYRDTGVILNVTPRINYKGIIILEIDQQVSNARPGVPAVGVDSPVISTRQLRTKLAVKDGQSIMMGGMIRKDTNIVDSGVPLLKDVPGLGWLFKSQTENTTRTELLVMITPYVIESEDVLQQYFTNFQKKVTELRKELNGNEQGAVTSESDQ
jgi:general secretion pathway protein D